MTRNLGTSMAALGYSEATIARQIERRLHIHRRAERLAHESAAHIARLLGVSVESARLMLTKEEEA